MRLENEEVYQGNDIQEIKKVIKSTIQKALIEPLFASIKHNNLEAVKELIEAGANVNSSDTFEGSALNYAVTNSTIGMVELLLTYNANPNQDGNRSKVLAAAIKQGDEAKVKALIKAKIDINCTAGAFWDHPLYIVAEQKNSEMLKILIDAGIDLSANHYRAMEGIIREGDVGMAKTILQKLGNVPTDCHIHTDSPEMKNLLKSYGWKDPYEHNFDQFKGARGGIIAGGEIIINAPKIINTGTIIAGKGVKISAGSLEGGGEIIAPSIELLHNLSESSSEEEISEMMGVASIEQGEDFY